MSLDSRKEKSPPNARMVPNARIAAALMAQRPPTKRPRDDALLEAERSHQRRRIELLNKRCSRPAAWA